MTRTRTGLKAVSIAAALAAGSLALTGCGTTAPASPVADGGPVTVTSIDGQFGDQTLAGVQHFQEDQDLPVTGVVDEATWAALAPQSCGNDTNDNGFIDPNEIDLGAEGCVSG